MKYDNNNNGSNLILLEDLGMRFPNTSSNQKRRYGIFMCFCGNKFEARIGDIKNGKQKSCGCLIGKNKITHGLKGHRLYGTWNQMMYRCYNSNSKAYKYYGGRGITVCERWHSVENFIEDMYPTFTEGLTLDRINVDGNYEQSNCRWATITIQTRNTRVLRKDNTSGYRGVTWDKARNMWSAKISVNNKNIYLGHFKTVEEGAIAYNNYVIENNLEHTLNLV